MSGDFLPPDYAVPKPPSQYMKWQEGANKFRVLSPSLITGYEWWNNDNRPVRKKEMPTEEPLDIKKDPSKHWNAAIKHFWAFVVWNYTTKAVEILEVTQPGIMNALETLFRDAEWGHPSKYDITVTRVGKTKNTKYNVTPNPHKALTNEQKEAYEATPIRLEALFDGSNPFAQGAIDQNNIKVSDLPF